MRSTVSVWITSAVLLLSWSIHGQELQRTDVDLPISKTAKKKGMYVATTLDGEDNITTYISYDLKKKQLGFDAIRVSPAGALLGVESEVYEGGEIDSKYNVTIPSSSTISYPNGDQYALRLVTASGVLGSMKIEKGYWEPAYATSVEYGAYYTTYTSVFKGFKFKEDETFKSGNKINIISTHVKPEENIALNYTIVQGAFKIGTVGFLSTNGTVAYAGKDVQLYKEGKYSSNVLSTGRFEGSTKEFVNQKQVVLDYNFSKAVDGYAANGDRAILLAPLNAPTSSKELNKYQAKGTPYLTFITFDLNGDVDQNITFEGKSVRGNFGVFGFDDANFMIGSVNGDHDGYYRFDVGEPTHLEIVRFVDNAISDQRVYSYEELEEKIITPGGGKAKFKFKDIKFGAYLKAPNGDLLAMAAGPKQYMLFQIGAADGELKALYYIEKGDVEETFDVGVQSVEVGDAMYILFRQQNGGISQGLKKGVSRGAGYMKNVNFSRVDDMMTFGKLVLLNPSTKTCSEEINFMDKVILGEEPMFLGEDNKLILPLRDFKRRYSMAVIQN
jgi:hypothetical protein